jgi:predicted dehydrogenase
MKPTILRWGLLGTAHINRALIPPLRASKRNTLTAVASRSLAKAQAYAHEQKIPRATGSYEELLEDPEIDVIYISLPNHLHAKWAIRAVEAGKHVLCEKPLALSTIEIDALIQASQASGKYIAEAFMYRHHPQTLKVQEMVWSGKVGQVRMIKGAFSYTLNRPHDIRLEPIMGGGSLWDVGCYPLSYARAILRSEPEEVFAWQTTAPSGVDDLFVAQARFPGGIFAQFDSGFRLPHRAYMEIIGENGSIYVPHPFKPGKTELIRYQRSDGFHVSLMVPGGDLYRGEVEDLADVILEGKEPRISLVDSKANVAAICALYESARTHKPVMLITP